MKLFEEIYKKAKLSETEEKETMSCMSDNFDSQNDPKVGFFWYDKENDELFGVNTINANDLSFNSNGKKTLSLLHKTWWLKQRNRLKAKGQPVGRFSEDYTLTPRGRIFQLKSGLFQLMVGSWIEIFPHVVELVKDEFDLQDVPFEVIINDHWEIGRGWSEEYF